MPFNTLLNFTFGELKDFIEYRREQHRRSLQEKAVTAYHQAMLTAKIISGGDVGEVFEEFPYWTEDEILDIKVERALQYFNDACE